SWTIEKSVSARVGLTGIRQLGKAASPIFFSNHKKTAPSFRWSCLFIFCNYLICHIPTAQYDHWRTAAAMAAAADEIKILNIAAGIGRAKKSIFRAVGRRAI